MRNINLDYLQAFVKVANLGSFSAAAEHLNLTQPAISQQVRQLESMLGTTLIERVGRQARPTAAGAELLEHAGRIDAAVTAAVEAMARRATGAVGRVRFGTGATACIFLLPPILKRLRERLPGLEIIVTTGNTADIVRGIEDNLLDIGLVTMPVAGRVFHVAPVLDDDFMLYAPKDMALPDRITARSLIGRPVLLFEPGGNTRRITDGWFAKAHVDLKPIMSLGSIEAIKQLVAAGLGCAILPGLAVRGGAAGRDTVVRPLSPGLRRRLAVVVRRDKPLQGGLNDVFRALLAIKA